MSATHRSHHVLPARLAALVAGTALLASGSTHAQTCTKAWLPVSTPDQGVYGFTVFDDGLGGGPALYAAGDFLHAGAVAANYVAKFDGGEWSALGGGLTLGDGMFTFGDAVEVFDDGLGGGPALYATGRFHKAGGQSANNIAKWDGASWAPLGSGLTGDGACMAVFDDGSGPALYVGGSFTLAGGTAASRIARWDGTTWSALGTGTNGTVGALLPFDDGSGPALYAAGGFTTAGGSPAGYIAKWDGVQWSAVGGGLDDGVEALAAFDDGSGPKLYAGGRFAHADGLPASYIARWDGAQWSEVGGGVGGPYGPPNDGINALQTFDDGSGPALYAAGNFVFAGGDGCNRIAKWDGATWSWLGAGIDPQYNLDSVYCLAGFDAGAGPELFVGGPFLSAGDLSSNYFARWGCSPTPPVWTYLSSALTGSSNVPYLTGTGTLVAATPCSLKLFSAKKSTPAMLLAGLSDTPSPFKGGTVHPVPTLLSMVLATNSFGQITLPFSAPALPPGLDIYYQFVILDPAGPHGFALSNALKSTSP